MVCFSRSSRQPMTSPSLKASPKSSNCLLLLFLPVEPNPKLCWSFPSSSLASAELHPIRLRPSTTSTSNMYLPFRTENEPRTPPHLLSSSLLHSRPSPVTRTNASLSFGLSSHLVLEPVLSRIWHLPRSCSWTICMQGSPKAPVLPLPVSDATSTSPPVRISGTASCWTAVGRSQSSSSIAWMISGQIPSSSNALMAPEDS
mmetsp:Transcript_19073/g.43315  ORF Transcript_19073/g.43315 Transcript_19073/m.43315 type:complete len:201 (+) Transcript_19073:2088-2690(+)